MLNSILALFIISCATLQHSLTFPEPQFLYGLTLWKLEQRSQHPSVAHWEATICWVLCWTQKKPTVVEAEEVDGDRKTKNRCRCGRNFKEVIPLSSRWFTDYLFQLQIPGWSTSGEAWDSSLFALCATGVLPEPHRSFILCREHEAHAAVHAHRSRRLTSDVFLSHRSTLCVETDSFGTPGSYQFGCTSVRQSPGVLLCLLPACWGFRDMGLCLAF